MTQTKLVQPIDVCAAGCGTVTALTIAKTVARSGRQHITGTSIILTTAFITRRFRRVSSVVSAQNQCVMIVRNAALNHFLLRHLYRGASPASVPLAKRSSDSSR